MPQQTRDGHDAVQAAPDETTRLDGGPSAVPPPATGAHAQSARHGQPPVPGTAVPAADEPDDTRPVSREWLKTAPAEQPAPERPPAEEWSTQELSGSDVASPVPAEPEESSTDDPTGLLPVVPDDDGPGTPEPPSGEDDDAGSGGGGPRRPWWRRRAVLAPAAAVVVLGAAYGVDLLLSSGDIPRHTVVAGVEIGGLSPADAARTLEKELGPKVAADHTVTAGDFSTTLSPATAGLTLDVDATVDAGDDQPLNPWTRLTSLFSDHAVEPVLATDDVALGTQLDAIAAEVDVAPVEASIAFDGTTPSVVAPADGRTLDRTGATAAITGALASGADPAEAIRLPIEVAHPHVDATEAQRVLDETVTPALAAPVTLVSDDGGTSVEIPVEAIAASLTFTAQDSGELAVSLDPAKLQTALGDQLGEFGSPAKDATFEVHGDSVEVVPSVDGTGVDPAALAQQLMTVLPTPAPRTVTAQLGPVPAAFTTEQAQSLGITEKVSSFTTHFTMTPSATNIRVIAEKVDGAIVKPGETFSLNDFTGPRGTAQGYVPANVIEGGQLTKAVGGGISQFATTMYNAVFFAGLEDVHHKTHSFYISRYPAGREATVFDGLIDLAWKNDSDTGIYVQTQWVSGGSITVTFWGTRHYDIESVSSDRRNVTEPSVQDKPDDGSCIAQSGAQGFDITVTRIWHDLNSGAVVKKESLNTHYIPEAVIHCVPAAPTDPAAPAGTTPPPGTSPGGRRPGGRRTT
jgi:vancomycin resistance protein YoaR